MPAMSSVVLSWALLLGGEPVSSATARPPARLEMRKGSIRCVRAPCPGSISSPPRTSAEEHPGEGHMVLLTPMQVATRLYSVSAQDLGRASQHTWISEGLLKTFSQSACSSSLQDAHADIAARMAGWRPAGVLASVTQLGATEHSTQVEACFTGDALQGAPRGCTRLVLVRKQSNEPWAIDDIVDGNAVSLRQSLYGGECALPAD